MAETKKTTDGKPAASKKNGCARKSCATRKAAKASVPQHIGLVKNDKWLEPFEEAIRGRHSHAEWMIGHLTNNGKKTLSDFASGYLYYGLHRTKQGGWVFREWAPNATEIYLIGDFNNWQESPKYEIGRAHV